MKKILRKISTALDSSKTHNVRSSWDVLNQSLDTLLILIRLVATLLVAQATLFVFALFGILSHYVPEFANQDPTHWQQGITTLWFDTFDITLKLFLLVYLVAALKWLATRKAGKTIHKE